MYAGEVNVAQDQLPQFLKTAEKLKVGTFLISQLAVIQTSQRKNACCKESIRFVDACLIIIISLLSHKAFYMITLVFFYIIFYMKKRYLLLLHLFIDIYAFVNFTFTNDTLSF